MNYIYFKTTNGRLITNYNVSTVAEIKDNKKIDAEDFDAIRKYAKLACSGIVKEIKKPSVNFLIKKGRKAEAVMLYYHTHDNISLSEAKEIIDEIVENRLNNRRNKE